MPHLTTTVALVELQCRSCGTFHAIPKVMHDSCVEEGGYWTCPNGHTRGFKEGRHAREAVRLERDRLKQQLAERDDALRAAEQRVAKEQSKVRKLKTRAAAGVCPCCNRQFQNLHMHMMTKHKDFAGNVVPLKSA